MKVAHVYDGIQRILMILLCRVYATVIDSSVLQTVTDMGKKQLIR